MLAPLYMAEISPPEVRGSLMALEQFSIVLGAVLGFWTGFVTRNVPGSSSWRVPLGIQLGPGILLALGCLFLPPSPRLLVMQGRTEEALRALARLRLRTPDQIPADPLLKVELLEMQVEAQLVAQAVSPDDDVKAGTLRAEARAWARLFGRKYRRRTFIGIMMMFFQRACDVSREVRNAERMLMLVVVDRVERHQCAAVLRPDADARARLAGRERDAGGLGRDWDRAVLCGVTRDCFHRPVGP